MHNIFYVSLLHPCLPGGTQKGPLDPIVAGDNQEYKIKRFVSHNKIKGRLMYQVRWRGYDAMEDS